MAQTASSSALPPLTEDLGKARVHLASHGCCRLRGALRPGELDRIREAIARAARDDQQQSVDYAYSGGSNQRVWSLFNRGEIFLALAEHPVALSLMEAILGPDALVSNLSANITGPRGSAMKPHWDQDWAARPWPQALAAHVIWMIDDFTVENGATLVAPRSHLLDGPPPPGSLAPAVGPAGTAMALDGRTWHGTGQNTSGNSRRIGVLAYYCRPYIRQQENFSLSMHKSIQDSLNPARRRLFGLEFYEYLNMVDGPPRDLPRY